MTRKEKESEKTKINHQSNMAIYQSRGRISDMSEVHSGTSKNGYEWQRMTITLEIPGFQGSVFKQVFQVSGNDVNDVCLYNIGDRVEISWSMYAREWNGKWYNNVELVKIKPQDMQQFDHAPGQQASRVKVLVTDSIDHSTESLQPQENDLPF